MWRKVYLLVPLGRGDRGDDLCRGGVVNGGLWWSEKASKVSVLTLQPRENVAGDSPEDVFLFLVKRGGEWWW